jgi:hypothetical protein
MLYNIYILGEKYFLDNCIKNLKNQNFLLSTTDDVELFKTQLNKITDYDNTVVLIDESLIGKHNKKYYFVGKKMITYNFFDNNKSLEKINMISFEIKKFNELEPKILKFFASVEKKQEEEKVNGSELIVSYKEEEMATEELIEDIDSFNVEDLIKEANKDIEEDFNEKDIEDIVNTSLKEQKIDLKEVKKEETKEFTNKKVETIGPKGKEETNISSDDIDAMFAKKPKDKKPKLAKKHKTVGQSYLDHLTEEQVFQMVQDGSL